MKSAGRSLPSGAAPTLRKSRSWCRQGVVWGKSEGLEPRKSSLPRWWCNSRHCVVMHVGSLDRVHRLAEHELDAIRGAIRAKDLWWSRRIGAKILS